MNKRKLFMLSLILTTLFALLTILVITDSTSAWDRSVNNSITGTLSASQISFFKIITNLADPYTIIAGIFLIIFATIKHPLATKIQHLLLLSVGGSATLNYLIKSIIQRPRPDLPHLVHASSYSFPSGHAMTGTVFYLLVAFLAYYLMNKKRKNQSPGFNSFHYFHILLLLTGTVISLIALSRVILNVHYPTDVLAGVIAGGAWACFALGHSIESFSK